jgi:hypothetical protein
MLLVAVAVSLGIGVGAALEEEPRYAWVRRLLYHELLPLGPS